MMAEPVTTIPMEIAAWITSTGGSHALQLLTVDAYLRPHVMLLARDEVFLAAPSRLRVAVGERSRSAENLRTRASATLTLYDADLACVVKTRVVEGPRALVDGSVAFDLRVEDVHLDKPAAHERSARLTSGLRFEGRAERLDIRDGLRNLKS